MREEGAGGLYVCRFIDNFAEHVLDSPLSKRGWALQERALARRAIYFTDWQTLLGMRRRDPVRDDDQG